LADAGVVAAEAVGEVGVGGAGQRPAGAGAAERRAVVAVVRRAVAGRVVAHPGDRDVLFADQDGATQAVADLVEADAADEAGPVVRAPVVVQLEGAVVGGVDRRLAGGRAGPPVVAAGGADVAGVIGAGPLCEPGGVPVVGVAGGVARHRSAAGGAEVDGHRRHASGGVLCVETAAGHRPLALEVRLLDVGEDFDQPGVVGVAAAVGQGAAVVVERVARQAHLLEVVGAADAGGGLADLLGSGQEQADQDGND